MAQTPHGDLLRLDDPLPTCAVHGDRVSYVRCRRCDAPVCPDCRTASRLGSICRGCTAELREADSALVPAPWPIATGVVCLLLLLAGVAQGLSPDLTRHLAYAPFATLVEPWRILTGPFSVAGSAPLLTTLLAVIAVGFSAFVVESLRGAPAMLTTALTASTAGYAAAYLGASPDGPGWYTGLVGPSAAVAGLAVAGACAALTLHRPGFLLPAAAGVLVLGLSAWLLAPVSAAPVVGAVAAALVMEVVRAFFRRPQRAVLPLMVSALVAWALVIAAFLVRGLLN